MVKELLLFYGGIRSYEAIRRENQERLSCFIRKCVEGKSIFKSSD